ncbi:hypothetical protein [Acidianus ambivalens]|uniref:hypothetical protein n=1 Tax=Acidianus ambivalens TaxID=2283 RepID=UPI001E4A977C|nr:hypothetical protein [Acidianus ambivalens]
MVEGILDEVFYYLGNKRSELFTKYDSLFDSITEGEIKDLKVIRDLRREVENLYADSSSLYYMSKKLSKFLR